MEDFFQYEFLNNTLFNWTKFIVLILSAYLFRKYISTLLGYITYSPFRRFTTETEVKKFIQLLLKPFEYLILFFTVYFAFRSIHPPFDIDYVNEEIDLKVLVNQLFKTIGAVLGTWVLLRVIDFISYVVYQKSDLEQQKIDKQIIPFLKDTVKVLVCIFMLAIILGVIFKINIASIIAGIGIGGLTLALATKESLENLLGSFIIFIDKPFIVGDNIKVGNVSGVVESVGFRSTRVRTDNKTYITMPNKQLIDAVLDNLTERTYRKCDFKLFYDINTSHLAIENSIKEMTDLFKKHPLIDADFSIFFNAITQYGFEINISYMVPNIDVKEFNQLQQEVNLQILEIILKNKITLNTVPLAVSGKS